MWIKCRCGNPIHDSTDKIPYKARFIPDKIWFDIFDEICAGIEKGFSKEELTDLIYAQIWDNAVSMYQCTECGRLFIENKDNSYTIFKAEQGFGHHKKFDGDLIFDTE